MVFNLEDEIKNRRPNITESTLKVYLSNLKKLNNKEEITSLDYLKDVEVVSSIFAELSIPTQRNYITSVLVALTIYDRTENWDKEWKPIYDKYKKLLDDKTSVYQKTIESHSKSEKQEANWITRKQQLKLINLYKRQLKDINFNIDNPSKFGIKTFQNLIIVSLYYYQAPRRLDYAPISIIHSRDDNDRKKNYLLVLNKNKKFFIFNQYKTVKIHGVQEIPVSKPLNNLLNKWIQVSPKYLLLNSQGNALSSNGLCKAIKSAFEPSGISGVSANILRHVYATEVIGVEQIEKSKEMKKVAEEMGHSVPEQLNYIKV